MSSMRNAVQRRNHKERAQPTERSKWGILEKHKDYSLRARDHNEKKKRIKALKQKVADRNPDEFAFGMVSSTSKGGIKQTKRGDGHGATGPLSVDVAKLLKTQDAGYLQTVLQQTRRERERVEMEALQAGAGVDTGLAGHGLAKRVQYGEDGIEILPEPLVDDVSLDDESDDMADGEKMSKAQIQLRRKQKRGQEVLGRRLETLVERERELARALEKLQEQRAKMNGTIGGINKNGTKFKVRERKR